jgi:hypothetical protein
MPSVQNRSRFIVTASRGTVDLADKKRDDTCEGRVFSRGWICCLKRHFARTSPLATSKSDLLGRSGNSPHMGGNGERETNY